MDTGPQKESDTTGSKKTKSEKGRKKEGISRPGQRHRWEMIAVQAGRRQVTHLTIL